MDFMNFIGLIGLVGLLGFFGRDKLRQNFEELRGDINKNSEQTDSRVKNIEKIAADANRKAQNLSDESQHFATKIDTEKISERLKAVETAEKDDEKINAVENEVATLRQNIDEVAQINTNLQAAVKILEEKNYEETLQHFDEGLKNLNTAIQALDKNLKTVTENVDGNFKTCGDEINKLIATSKTVDNRLTSFDERITGIESHNAETAEELPDEKLAAIEENHKVLTERVGEFNSVLQKHHVALVQWKNNFIAIQNHFNSIQANFEEHKKILDFLQSHFDEQAKLIDEIKSAPVETGISDELKEKLSAQENILTEFKSKFDAQENVLAEFKSKFDAQEKILDDFDDRFGKQESLFFSFKESLDEIEKVFDAMEGDKFLTIENFDIKPTGKIFFTNKPNEVFENLKIASNLTGITSFLASSTFSKKENFIRIIENYRQSLKKVTDKVRRKKFNEDALSEEVTDAFFNTLSKHFLATIPISIYRGARLETLETLDDAERDEDFKFYSAFLEKVNEYLAACQVYTAPIVPKTEMTSADIDRMSVTRKETSDKHDDNIIDEVERLPYYMDYLTENGETENFCSEGKMVVLKFDGGAQ